MRVPGAIRQIRFRTYLKAAKIFLVASHAALIQLFTYVSCIDPGPAGDEVQLLLSVWVSLVPPGDLPVRCRRSWKWGVLAPASCGLIPSLTGFKAVWGLPIR